ncbi:TPA: hypothetical protein HA318_03010 [Candidatus Micrarchaeota archaeon]|nr:hypothetical protein [Candidatus Micrarchaeota archaeon]
MAEEDLALKEAYLEGRLLGLNELIGILRDSMDEEGSTQTTIFKSVVAHISSEMQEILDELKVAHGASHPVIKEASVAVKAMAKEAARIPESKPAAEVAPIVRKNVEIADDLMKNLMALKEKPKA